MSGPSSTKSGPPATSITIEDRRDSFDAHSVEDDEEMITFKNNASETKTFQHDDDDGDDCDRRKHHSLPEFADVNFKNTYADCYADVSICGRIFFFPRPSYCLRRTRKISSLTVYKWLSTIFAVGIILCAVELNRDGIEIAEENHHFLDSDPTFEATKWAPLPPSSTPLTRFAFGSCADQSKPHPHWDTLAVFDPNVTILGGDNVYGECSDKSCSELADAYATLANHASFLGAKEKLPIIAALDDHDYGKREADVNNPYKDTAKNMFLNFFNVPFSDKRRRPGHQGVYTSYEWGPVGKRVQVIILDTRYGRSPFLATDHFEAPGKEHYVPDYDDNKRMLSDKQWKWLGKKLGRKANVRLIVSPIQVLSEGSGFGCWRMLPHERLKLYDMLLNDEMNSLTIVLSGNRHVGALYKRTTEGGNLYEMTASSLTHTIPIGFYASCEDGADCDETDDARITDLVRSNNFGLVDIDWDKFQVVLDIRKAQASNELSQYQNDAGHILEHLILDIPKDPREDS